MAIFIGVKLGVSGNPSELPQWYAILVVLFICIYVSAFAWSWGPLGWLVPREIFTFIIAQIFPTMLCHFKFGLFLFFAFFVIVMSVFIYIFLLETKGIPIEEMSPVWKKHPFWGKYIPDDELSLGATDLEMGKK